MSEDASSEGVEAEVPNGHDGGVLEHVRAVQKQKDAPVEEKKTDSLKSRIHHPQQ